MTRREFMRASLALPLVLPFLSALVACALAPSGLSIANGASAVAATLLPSILVAGIPYCILAAVAAYSLRHKSERAHHIAAALAPIAFAAVLFILWFLVGFATFSEYTQAATLGGYYAAVSLAYSVPYVVLVYLLLWILSRAGCIELDQLPPIPWRTVEEGSDPL